MFVYITSLYIKLKLLFEIISFEVPYSSLLVYPRVYLNSIAYTQVFCLKIVYCLPLECADAQQNKSRQVQKCSY